MRPQNTALILIGYQNDYFASDGVLNAVISDSVAAVGTLKNTLQLLENLTKTDTTIITTPIVFSPDYRELKHPIGILKTIQEIGAFKEGSRGSETIPEIEALGDRVIQIQGKQSLNAFSNTGLQATLKNRDIQNVVIAGAVTSVCIDSTARSAFEDGYSVTVLSDCTAGRTHAEQEMFCNSIFPVFSHVTTSQEFLADLDDA
jgi:nicotinamidase-related amidase